MHVLFAPVPRRVKPLHFVGTDETDVQFCERRNTGSAVQLGARAGGGGHQLGSLTNWACTNHSCTELHANPDSLQR